jgi:glycosyltransferase involved in cell wall biosynthesis
VREPRILYAALDQTVPGTLGGSIHVQSVAEGLSRLGYEVHVATQPGGLFPFGDVHWHAMGPPFGRPQLRWARAHAIADLAARVGAQLIMERYYNFGGEGVLAARRLGLPAVLEVNAPIIDYPDSTKARIDKVLMFEPMRRWRERLCRMTDLFVTPTRDVLPPWTDPKRVLQVEWGADVDHFRPGAPGTPPVPRDRDHVTCVFAGAFRSWHGVVQLAAALSRLHAAGDDRFAAVLIGDGPEREAAERAARGVPRITFTGALPHDALPAALGVGNIGVAPFDPTKHAPLQLGFYWSPLKIFEYMAMGLPVVAPALPRLERLVEHGREGLLYDPKEPRGLDRALIGLADRATRERLGAAARVRVVRQFSWDAHCRALDARLRPLIRPPVD